jgi:hypothetical protein
MKNCLRLLVMLLTIFNTTHAVAELEQYKVSESFYAPFPSAPSFLGQAGQDKQKINMYMYADKGNARVYSAIYPVYAHRYKSSVVEQALKYHVKGQMSQHLNLKIESIKIIDVSGSPAIRFVATYSVKGQPNVVQRKFGVAIYKDGKIYQWAINENALNTESVESIFNENLQRVRIK